MQLSFLGIGGIKQGVFTLTCLMLDLILIFKMQTKKNE